ncbi:MAG: response regulator, partial [Nitrospirae bacterium]
MRSHEESVVASDSPRHASAPPQPDQWAGKAEPATILLVDDEKLSRLINKKRLSRLGHQILEAQDGVEALKILRQQPVELVISDWMMPERDGPT